MDCETIRKRHVADEYLAGRLSDEEAVTYERHYFECDRCFEDLRHRELIAQQLKQEGATLFAPEIAAEQTGRLREEISSRWSQRGWLGRLVPVRPAWAAGLAVALAAVVVVLLVSQSADRSAHLRDLWTPTPYPYIASDLRGGPGSEEFHRGMDLYTQGQYPEAAEWLERSIALGSPEDAAHFYLGVSRLLAGDAQGATQALESATALAPSSDLYRWYLAQALLARGDVDAAEDELARVVASGGEHSSQAERLLQKLLSRRR